MTASRVSWILHFGEIPDGAKVLHKCGNPLCVRPDHLMLGTYADIPRTRVRGEGNGQARLKASEVEAIRASLRAGDKQSDIARDYNVAPSTISAINRGENWSH